MSFKFPKVDLSSIQQSLQQTTQQLTSSLQDNLVNLEKEVSTLNSNISPLLKRTTRSLQERFGSIDDISELPQEYKDLEKRVDNLKVFYKKVLTITQQYEIESYDYPPNLKESIHDYTKLINEKFTGLSQATTTSEAEAVLLASSKDHTPKTFAHQLAKACFSANEVLSTSEDESSSLCKALLKISEFQTRIGEERLEQDKLVITEVNDRIRNTLNGDFLNTAKLRKQVETSRLNFDTVRAEVKAVQRGDESVELPPALSKKLENAEDELVSATESAVESMKTLIKPVEGLNLLKLLMKIQLNYHKNVVSELSSLVDELDSLPLEDD
ncbi:hypothetical protein KL919_000693 [Ogataea angusta]|nr:hypothetical protein KL920_000069 [Ogataea angusta]KAG7835907.1 hypothetical protein KL943_001556 [Ogataea angusta]KAG7854566.1 hypothetical protein KL939_004839 [Ogataea angusta]KAG7863378.1 hypothetical protein KL919_000693 [Ogataea angusta]